jgi:hypothetical protein
LNLILAPGDPSSGRRRNSSPRSETVRVPGGNMPPVHRPPGAASTFLILPCSVTRSRQRTVPVIGYRSGGSAGCPSGPTSGDQNLPLNLPTKRRLCSTVGGRIVDGRAAHCCAVSTARSRAATMTNLARSSLALALPALFGAAKSCALVNVFMICPRWSTGDPSRRRQANSAPDSGLSHGMLNPHAKNAPLKPG